MKIIGYVEFKIYDQNGNLINEYQDTNNETIYAKWNIGNIDLYFDFVMKDLKAEFGMEVDDITKTCWNETNRIKSNLMNGQFNRDTGNNRYTYNFSYLNGDKEQLLYGFLSRASNNKLTTLFYLDEPFLLPVNTNIVGTYIIEYYTEPYSVTDTGNWRQATYTKTNNKWIEVPISKNLREYKYTRHFLKTSKYYGLSLTDTNIQSYVVVNINSLNLNNAKALSINGLDSSYFGSLYYEFKSDGNIGQATAVRYFWFDKIFKIDDNSSYLDDIKNINFSLRGIGKNTYQFKYNYYLQNDKDYLYWSDLKNEKYILLSISDFQLINENNIKPVDKIPVYPIKMYFPKTYNNESLNKNISYSGNLTANALPLYSNSLINSYTRIVFTALLYLDELNGELPKISVEIGDINSDALKNIIFYINGIQCPFTQKNGNWGTIYDLILPDLSNKEYCILQCYYGNNNNEISKNAINHFYVNLFTNLYAYVGYNLWNMDISNTEINDNWISSNVWSKEGKNYIYGLSEQNNFAYGGNIDVIHNDKLNIYSKTFFVKKSEKDKIIGYIVPFKNVYLNSVYATRYSREHPFILGFRHLDKSYYSYYRKDPYSQYLTDAFDVILYTLPVFCNTTVFPLIKMHNLNGLVEQNPNDSRYYYFISPEYNKPIIYQISEDEFILNGETYINSKERIIKPIYETSIPFLDDYIYMRDGGYLKKFAVRFDEDSPNQYRIIRWNSQFLNTPDFTLKEYDTGKEYHAHLITPIQQTESINSLNINFSTDSIFKTGEFLDIQILDDDNLLCTDALEEWQSFSYNDININEADEYALFPNQYIGTDTLIATNDYNNTDKTLEYTMPIESEINIINDNINYNLLPENQFQLIYSLNIPNKERLDTGNTLIIIPKEITSNNNIYYTDISTLSITTGIHPINWTLRPVHEIDKNVLNIDVNDYWFVVLDNESLKEIANGEYNSIVIYAFVNTKLSTANYNQQIKLYYLDTENTLTESYYIVKLELPFKINPHCNIMIGNTTVEYCLLDSYGIDKNDTGSNIVYIKLPKLSPSSLMNVNVIKHELNIKYNGSIQFTFLKKSFYYKYEFNNGDIYIDKEMPLMKYRLNVSSAQSLDGINLSNYSSINTKNNTSNIIYNQIVYPQYGNIDNNFTQFPSPYYITINYDATKNPTSPSDFFPLYFTYKSDINQLTILNGSIDNIQKTNDGILFNGNVNYGISLPGIINRDNDMWFECNIAGNTNFLFYGDDTTAFDPNKYTFKFSKSLNSNEKISHIDMVYSKEYNEIQIPNHDLSTDYAFMTFNGDHKFLIPRYPISGSIIGNKLILYNVGNIIGILGYNFTSNIKIENYKMPYKMSQQPKYQNVIHYYNRNIAIQQQVTTKEILINNYDCQKPIWNLPNIKGFWLKDFLKNVPLKTTYAMNNGFDIKTYYLDVNDFDTSYPRHRNSIFPNENINDEEIEIYVGPPTHFDTAIRSAAPIINISNIKKIIGDSFELYDENNNKVNYAFLNDNTTSSTVTTTVSTNPTNRIVINDNWINSDESQERKYINYFDGNYNGVYYRSSSYYYPDNLNNSFIVDYNFINPRFNLEMFDLLTPLQYSVSFIHNENINNLKSWYLEYENLDSKFDINTITFPKLTPSFVPLPLIRKMNMSLAKNQRGVAKYTIKKSSTPNTMNNAVVGIFTDNIEFKTKTNVGISTLLLQKDKIPTDVINTLNEMKWHNIKAKYNSSEIKSIVILKLNQTNKQDSTQPIISKYYFINTYNVLEDITDKIEKLNYQYIIDNGMNELTSLWQFNKIINENKSTSDYQYDIQFGFIFGILEPDSNKMNNIINQFFGVSIYIDFVDNGMYKRLKWAYIDSKTGNIQSNYNTADSIIIEPCIASWYLIDLNTKVNNNSEFFNNNKLIYTMPISSMVNNASFGYKIK